MKRAIGFQLICLHSVSRYATPTKTSARDYCKFYGTHSKIPPLANAPMFFILSFVHIGHASNAILVGYWYMLSLLF